MITFYAEFDEGQLNDLVDSIPDATVAAIWIGDWNNDLSPWEAPPVFGKAGFGNRASDTLSFIEEKLIPVIGCESYAIGGYSLAGLFSLWACYSSEAFDYCMAASPSVWFPGWDAFTEDNEFRSRGLYLSLGDKESHTKNAVMSKVDERIRMQYDSLVEELGELIILEWNSGGHFQECTERTSRGFRWILNHIVIDHRMKGIGPSA